MMNITDSRGIRHWFSGSISLRCALATVFLLAGCSEVPDYANPVEWYKSASDAITGGDDEEDTATQTAGASQTTPNADKPFPKLSSTPQKPTAKGLVADVDRPRYASEPIQRQSAPANVLGQTTTARSAPPAVPVVNRSDSNSMVSKSATAAAQTSASAPAMPAAPRAPQVPQTPDTPTAAPEMPQMPKLAELAPMTQSGPFETVVISGDGVAIGESTPTQYAAAAGTTMTDEVKSFPALSRFDQAPVSGAIEVGMQKVATIQFVNGSASLDGRDQAVLRDVATLMKQNGGKRLVVVGHASSRTRNMDPVRHAMVNYRMSVARANAVADAMSTMGVDPNTIQVSARSDREPSYYEIMPSGEAGNRRAEIYIQY